MEEDAAALLARLRAGLEPDAQALQPLYERWLREDTWAVPDEALPLLAGIAPDDWDAHVERCGARSEAARLGALLAAGHAVREGVIAPAELGRWARTAGVELPAALGALLDFIARVLPASGTAAAPDAAPAGPDQDDRERVLGAALALVTKFPERCRDEHGFYDGERIAALILEKAALWFPDRPPSLSREAMATLLERYLV